MESPSSKNFTIATSYLQEAGNEQHKIWLTTEHLQMLYKGKLRVFELQQLRRLEFNHRKLMLPLVVGGTAATLSLVAIIKLTYNPWLMLSIMVAGCLLAYLGYQGSPVLTVAENKYHTDYFLRNISPNLRAFVAYANTFTGQQPKGILYLPLSQESWTSAKETGFLRPSIDQRLYYRHEFDQIPSGLSVLMPVNSLEYMPYLSWKEEESRQEPVPYLQAGSTLKTEAVRPYMR